MNKNVQFKENKIGAVDTLEVLEEIESIGIPQINSKAEFDEFEANLIDEAYKNDVLSLYTQKFVHSNSKSKEDVEKLVQKFFSTFFTLDFWEFCTWKGNKKEKVGFVQYKNTIQYMRKLVQTLSGKLATESIIKLKIRARISLLSSAQKKAAQTEDTKKNLEEYVETDSDNDLDDDDAKNAKK